MRRLRILHVIASSERGGAERAMTAMLNALDRERFEVWIACDGQGPMIEEYRRVATGVYSFDLRNVFDPRTVAYLVRLIRRLGVQVVHTQMWTADVLGGFAALLARVPVRVATVQGGYFQIIEATGARKARRKVLSRIYRFAYRLFDQVIAVSHQLADDLMNRPGIRVKGTKIAVIHNGLDLSRIHPSGNDLRRELELTSGPLVTTVANFWPIKGHRVLVDAMPDVLQRWPTAKFLLAGTGPELPAIRELVASAELSSSVCFLGPRDDAPDLLAISDCVVVPSVSEGLPVVVLEALALGKPVVATRVGGIPEIVEHGKSCLLTSPNDPHALADAIDTVLSDSGRSRILGENGQKIVRARFSADAITQRVQELYDALLTAKGIGSVYPGRDPMRC